MTKHEYSHADALDYSRKHRHRKVGGQRQNGRTSEGAKCRHSRVQQVSFLFFCQNDTLFRFFRSSGQRLAGLAIIFGEMK